MAENPPEKHGYNVIERTCRIVFDVHIRINEITPSFGEAVKPGGNRNSIQTARTAISALSTSFSKDVTELLKLN